MKNTSTLTQLFEFMEQNQYFIGNDLLAKYKELKGQEDQRGKFNGRSVYE
jgi:hypothetical protein|tara:strand:+ start:13 stop:162 length:150 start_codon:yes stop_codon:yes gene_type:complete